MIIPTSIDCKVNLLARIKRSVFDVRIPAIVLTLVWPQLAIGQQPLNKDDKLSAIAQDRVDPINKPVESQILMASKLIGTELNRGALIVGSISDLAFDLETEHLAVLVSEAMETGKQPEWEIIPFINGDRLIKLEWENKTRLSARPTALTRMQVNELFRAYKEAIYWIDFASHYQDSPGQKFDYHDFKLTLFKEIVDKPIADKFGEVIGNIKDVAIKASNGTILYMILRTADNRMIAIPLGAFVVDDKAFRWMIELPKDQILMYETFQEKSPPPKMDIAWQEYVANKYGRGGLQSKKSQK